jgi:hypothetical protein
MMTVSSDKSNSLLLEMSFSSRKSWYLQSADVCKLV